jgi:hypothetical protein
VIRLDDRRARSVPPLDSVGEPVVYPCIDLQLRDAADCESALDSSDQGPHQALPPIRGIDEHVEKACATLSPFRSRDRESDEGRSIPGRHDDGVGVRRLPPHLALGERSPAPLLAFELQHPRTKLAPGGRVKDCGFDRRSQSAPGDADNASVAREVIDDARLSAERVLQKMRDLFSEWRVDLK